MRGRSRVGVTLAVLCAALLPAGCSTLGPSADDAETAVSAFQAAVTAGDGAGACALLNAAAADDVESRTRAECSDGILTLGVPGAGTIRTAEVYGRSALVETESDVVFLTQAGSEWKVRAAGCTEVADAPFDCVIKGT